MTHPFGDVGIDCDKDCPRRWRQSLGKYLRECGVFQIDFGARNALWC